MIAISASRPGFAMVNRKSRVRNAKRRWGILRLPPSRDWVEVLQELPADLGLELCMSTRQVRLLADCEPDHRPRLFASKTAVHAGERKSAALNEAPAGIRPALRTLMRITGRRQPSGAEISRACEELAAWAQDAGYSQTALQLAEAGAAIYPENPQAAFVAGRTNRITGEPWRAQIFYSRAIRLASRQQDWDVYVRAHLGYGRLHAARGGYRAAAKHYYSAARVALDQGRVWLAAQTYHDLLALYVEAGDFEKAELYARKALVTYPLHHERYPLAVHDFVFLLVCKNLYSDAHGLLEKLTNAPVPPHDQVIVWSTYARTAGSLQLAEGYAEAEARVLELTPHYDLHAPAAFVNLALGARALGDWHLAAQYAERGIALAEAKGHRLAASVGRDVLLAIRDRAPAPPPAPPLQGEQAERLKSLAAVIDAQLSGWRSDTWTKKQEQYGLWTLGPV